ncbi:hypothetical protein L6452_35419 [Arctium lappa]|uniref:Uncharacterized protein n=1 Tax=Arctium lappa TaxID=4217 RepID=A0ACB8Y734_ARCLA|nr:hypothetical protein L6452_35419 [Arctium lappa]
MEFKEAMLISCMLTELGLHRSLNTALTFSLYKLSVSHTLHTVSTSSNRQKRAALKKASPPIFSPVNFVHKLFDSRVF